MEMSKALLQKVITNGVDGNLNDFFLTVSNFYTEKDDDLADYDDERLANFTGIGEVNFEDGQKLVVVTADTTRDLTERSGKKDQYERAKRILKFYTRYDAGIFVFSDATSNFRLSLVYGTPDATRTVWSNFRRFTYYASPALTNKTFLDRVGNCDFGSLAVVRDAFSVEKVNKEFYNHIARFFYRLTGYQCKREMTLPSVSDDDKETYQEFAVRLIGRTIFCWFLKHKKSEDGASLVPESVLSSESVRQNSQYYHSTLEKLFFEVLNTPQEQRHAAIIPNADKIPFLNGGLFEPHDDFYDNGKPQYNLVIPDIWFEQFFERLEQYNFTIDENSMVDADVSVDPEMLGRIFENLLAEVNPDTGETARKATGSYYTPRNIVDYMVEQSLKQYLITNTRIGEDKAIALLSYELPEIALSESERSSIISALDEIKIIDPACGSGAFPMGILQKMLMVLRKVDPDLKMWLKDNVDNIEPGLFKERLLERIRNENWEYVRKLLIIQKSIFGVDIQTIAVEISKLRFFLSLIVDEQIDDLKNNRGVEALPNLEFKFVAANSLIGLPPVLDRQIGLSAIDEVTRLKELRNKYLRSYGSEKKRVEEDFLKTRGKLIEQNTNWGSKDALALQLATWNPFSNEACDWFDAEWMFGEDGFDIVIANPPWGVDLSKETKLVLKERIPEIDSSTPNSFAYFIGIASRISKLNVAFILPDSVLIKDYAKTRRLIAPKLLSLDWYQNTSVPDDFRPFIYVEHDVCVVVFNNENVEKITCCRHQYDSRVKSVVHNEWVAPKSKVIFPEYDYVFNLMLGEKDHQIHDKLSRYETIDSFVQCHEGIHTGNSRDILFVKGKKNEYCKPLYYGARAGDLIANYVSKTSGWYVDYRRALIDKDRGHYASLRDENIFRHPKIYVTRTGSPFKSFYDENTYASNNFFSLQFRNKSENTKDNLLVLLCIINSKLTQYFIRTFPAPRLGGTYIETKIIHLLKVRAPKISNQLKDEFLPVIHQLLAKAEVDPKADITELENRINQMVYELYGLTPKEKAVVEGRFVKDNQAGITNVPEIRSMDEAEIDDQEEDIEEVAQLEIILTKDKETPGTWRYKEQKEDHPLTIYLTKEQVSELGSPESIRITITAE